MHHILIMFYLYQILSPCLLSLSFSITFYHILWPSFMVLPPWSPFMIFCPCWFSKHGCIPETCLILVWSCCLLIKLQDDTRGQTTSFSKSQTNTVSVSIHEMPRNFRAFGHMLGATVGMSAGVRTPGVSQAGWRSQMNQWKKPHGFQRVPLDPFGGQKNSEEKLPITWMW